MVFWENMTQAVADRRMPQQLPPQSETSLAGDVVSEEWRAESIGAETRRT